MGGEIAFPHGFEIHNFTMTGNHHDRPRHLVIHNQLLHGRTNEGQFRRRHPDFCRFCHRQFPPPANRGNTAKGKDEQRKKPGKLLNRAKTHFIFRVQPRIIMNHGSRVGWTLIRSKTAGNQAALHSCGLLIDSKSRFPSGVKFRGGNSSSADPQFSLGSGPMSNSKIPPAATSS